jgi:hypothetical protein
MDREGAFTATATEADVYQIEIEVVSDAIAGASGIEFGRLDASEQMVTIDAVRRGPRPKIRCFLIQRDLGPTRFVLKRLLSRPCKSSKHLTCSPNVRTKY